MTKKYLVLILSFLIAAGLFLIFCLMSSGKVDVSPLMGAGIKGGGISEKNIAGKSVEGPLNIESNEIMKSDGAEEFHEKHPMNPYSPLGQQYREYSEELLVELADGGDVMAMSTLAMTYQMIASKLADKGEMEEAIAMDKNFKAMVERAVIYGDRNLLKFIPELDRYKNAYLLSFSKMGGKDVAAAREALLNYFASLEFLKMRGDEATAEELSYSFKSAFDLPGFSTDDEIEVFTRANKLYKRYESKRLALGLGPFENSMSPFEEKRREDDLEATKKAIVESESGQ